MSATRESATTPMKWLLPLFGILALALGLWVGMQQLAPPAATPAANLKSATALNPPRALQPFNLTGTDMEAFTLNNLQGQWNFLAIGYTHCPDVCPTTMATFDAVEDQVKEQAAPAQFIFISVDPERDTPEKLGQYVQYFNPDFIGATGPHQDLQGLTSQLGILYGKAQGPETALGYMVDHSASILLIDPQGRLAAIFSTPHDPSAMADDFITITTQRNH